MATNKTLTDQLRQALDNNTQLIAALATQGITAPTPTSTTGTTGPRKKFNKADYEAKLDPNGYCWTHGYRVTNGHNSHNCAGKLKDHQDEATRNNNLGGSQKGKPV